MKIDPLPIDAPTVGRIYAKAAAHPGTSPFGSGTNPALLAEVLMRPDTRVFQLGDFGGVVIVTDLPNGDQVDGERIGRPHILVWDKTCLRQTKSLRAWALRMMQEWNIYRLVSEVPVTNKIAVAFDERMGFNRIGVLRDRLFGHDSKPTDCVFFDALQRDLDK